VSTKIIRGLYNVPDLKKGCVASIGNFDGVHLGHQELLAQVRQKANQLQLPSLVITFEPQPAEFYCQGPATIARITRWREKFSALQACGLDYVLVLRFDAKLAKLSAHDFIQQILIQGLAIKHLIVGDDFRFGFQRQGDLAFLKQAGTQYGFTTDSMPSIMINSERVSSTRIRKALAVGDLQLAEQLLGRPYSMQGRVVYGDKRGRSIGFPTANIYLHRALTPLKGVYVVRMHGIGNTSLPGVANIGVRPTVDGTRSLLEVHLFDFNQDIYRLPVSIEFCKKLRDERRFENLDELKLQINLDAQQARAYFSEITEMSKHL
jgi:riboflavin kinase / FMN adenylyltransferase